MASILPAVCPGKLKEVFDSAEKGSNTLLDIINELHQLQSSGNTDLKSIQTLLSKIEISKVNFETMIRTLNDVLQTVNKAFEAIIEKKKEKNDQLTSKRVKKSQLETSLKQKEKDVAGAEEYYRNQLSHLDTAESDLSSARGALETAKKKQRDMQLAGGVLMAIPIFGTIAGSTLLAVSFTAEQKVVELREDNVNNTKSNLEDSKNRLQRANNSRQVSQNELSAIERDQGLLKNEMRCLTEEMANLKAYQGNLIELNETMKNYYHEVSNFHGRFKVLYCESRGAYSITALSGPIATVLTSMSKLNDSKTTQSVLGTTRMVGLGGRIRQMEQLKWHVNEDKSIDDLC